MSDGPVVNDIPLHFGDLKLVHVERADINGMHGKLSGGSLTERVAHRERTRRNQRHAGRDLRRNVVGESERDKQRKYCSQQSFEFGFHSTEVSGIPGKTGSVGREIFFLTAETQSHAPASLSPLRG